MLDIHCLASGSSGNSYAIDDGKSVLLLEAGIKINKILQGYYDLLERVAGCLITHEHNDHAISTVKLHDSGFKIYASKGTLLNIKGVKPSDYGYIPITAGKQFNVGSYIVMPWQSQHDCTEPLGYLIYSTVTKDKLLFATDTYYIPNRFVGLNYIMVECNYSEEILRENLINGSINGTLAKRLRQSHFSLENVKDFLKANDLSRVEEIYLLHLSGKNADSKLFKEEMQRFTGKLITVF